MEEKIKAGYLYDFYGELLTEHQRTVYEMSVFEDLSLSEIADTLNISRQGVHDMLKRCDHLLCDYENKLHLVEKFLHIRETVEQIQKLSSQDITANSLGEIKDLTSSILEEL
ncbi:MAG: YlxM family DNA-binding protein [Pseudobutyrivibrio sp.]|nr:YlxM family DNA-binding protein [Pseudobutyrivibrio sp.]